MTAFAWTAALVTEALGVPAATWEHAYRGISTDTRSLQQGDLFIALKGEHFDAHDFLGDARLAEVGGVIVRKGTPRWPGFDWFEVDDTLVALGQLARLRRDRFEGPVVAITGTNGKTSTRALVSAALAPTLTVHASRENLNNLVGVPLTILAAPVEAGAMVVECGASLRGEISRMQQIVRPDIAVVTNVDAGHLEGFGSREAVFQEKGALLKDAPLAVVGNKPPNLPEAARKAAKKVIVAATEQPADWFAESIRMSPDGRATFTVRGRDVELQLFGRHMVGNALIALAVTDAVGVPLAEAVHGLTQAAIPPGRSEIADIDGITVINDSYNANPTSLRAALDLLRDLRGSRRAVVVVGTMRELGKESEALHLDAAKSVLALAPDLVVAIGAFGPAFESLGADTHSVRILTGDTPDAVAPALKKELQRGDLLLLKASRGVRLETLFPLLWPDHPAPGAH